MASDTRRFWMRDIVRYTHFLKVKGPMFRYRLVRLVMNITRLLLLARIKVYGRENIPQGGPYIVVLNHTSVADTPLLLLSFPVMKWRFFAVEKWKAHPIFGPIMAWLGAIFIQRDSVDRSALRLAMDSIREGTVFGLAPEGTRSKVGEMMKAKDGAAFLASRAQVSILPVGLVNLDVLFSNVRRLRPTTIEVRIGELFELPVTRRRVGSAELEALTHLIMVRIATLLPERYHGFYAGSPALAALERGEDPWPHCNKATTLEER